MKRKYNISEEKIISDICKNCGYSYKYHSPIKELCPPGDGVSGVWGEKV